MNPPDTPSGAPGEPEVVPYRESLREHFARLNRQWIEQDFRVEEAGEVTRFARDRGARQVYLVSNTKLGPALGLYRKHGFETTRLGPEVGQAAGYERADIEMVLTLRPTP